MMMMIIFSTIIGNKNNMLFLLPMMVLLSVMKYSLTSVFSYNMNIFYNYFIFDKLSFMMILIFLLIMYLLVVLTNIKHLIMNTNLFMSLMFLLNFYIIMTMYFNNLYAFYIFFEVSLIPMLMMIWGWGGFSKKINAGNMFLMYTSLSSLPFLFFILSVSNKMKIIQWKTFNILLSTLLHGLLVATCVFMVKLPVYTLHMWLPKAHVEASTMGSMVLAGSLLKLGSYGLNRMTLILEVNQLSLLILLSTLLHGLLVATCVGCSQEDFKMMIAYSSIIHMSMLAGSLLTNMNNITKTNIILSITHGLISPMMFYMIYSIYYNYKTRSALIIKYPLMKMFWGISIMFMFMLLCNIGCPPSFSLLGEMMLFMILLKFSKTIMIFMMIMISILMMTLSLNLFTRNYISLKMNLFKFIFKEIDLNYMALTLMMMTNMWMLQKYFMF
uniref:NADH-ubiquinone oxidoreductase chain 4 n=1 Tax=Chordodes sp. VVA-2019 TaxID=2586751 RepID=A0A514ABW5_9BILA|nr:NADH dehydrogenase subunit 4 [Chordodes sp. VVA-2019]